MSLTRNLRTEETQARLLRVATAALVLLGVLVVGLGASLWRGNSAPSSPSSTSVVLLPPVREAHAATAAPSLRTTTTCWSADRAFVQRLDDHCEVAPDGPCTPCEWTFTSTDGHDLTAWMEDPNRDPVLVFVYGGHDSVAIAKASRWDSNFELASQRALRITTWLEKVSDVRRIATIPIVNSFPPSLCDETDYRRDDLRRTPTLVTVTLGLGEGSEG